MSGNGKGSAIIAEAFVKQGLGRYYYKKENASLKEVFCMDI